MDRIEGLSIGLNLDDLQVQKGLTGLKRRLKTVNAEMKANLSAFDRADRSIEKYQVRLKGLNDKLEVQKRITAEAREQFKKIAQEHEAGSVKFEKAASDLHKETAALKNLERSINNTRADLQKLERDQASASRRFSVFAQNVDEAGDKIKTFGSSVKDTGRNLSLGFSLPIGAAGFSVAKMAAQFADSQAMIQAQLGETAERAKELNEIVKDVWQQGFGQSLDEVRHTLTKIKQNIQDINDEDLKEITKGALTLNKVFQADVNDTTRTASVLMKNFKIDGQKALDFITTGFQEGGDFAGDLLDTLTEYAPQFASMGMSADEFLNILISGAKNGAFNLDKVADAVKEFNIRAQDGSKATAEGFEMIGLNAEDMGEAISAGGEKAKDAFAATIAGLASIEDP
ncbi:MAG TPA: phage tail tape measure protein, partial [Bacillales bacterium]|nr:phage tail tape measure protein [Bacillales bacterium]